MHRSRKRDSWAVLYAPGATPDGVGLISVSLPADDEEDARRTGEYLRDVAALLVRMAVRQEAAGDMNSLKALISPAGPMGGASSATWHRVLRWLDDVKASTVTDPAEFPSVSL
ncbi:hypothetical protein [Streptomyces sp. NPDC056670]|uniref:hypothetical protein n=1 Tax=Streptomyces sp. NPDC056670 TaxID=3345904 RepID=UPI0036992DCE